MNIDEDNRQVYRILIYAYIGAFFCILFFGAALAYLMSKWINAN